MRLCFLTDHYPPTSGGIAISSKRIANELMRNGVDLFVVCFDHSKTIDHESYIIQENETNGLTIYKIGPYFERQPNLRIDEKIKALLRRQILNQLIQLINDNPVDLILGFNLTNSGYFSILLKREFNLPSVVCIRGDDIGLNIFDYSKFPILQWIVNGADKIICVNDHLKKRLQITFPESILKTIIIPNSILIDNLVINDKHSCRIKLIEKTTWDYDDIVLVFIGHLRDKKGLRIILESISLLIGTFPIRLLVVGPLLEHFELFKYSDKIEYLINQNIIHFTGFIPHNQTKEWLSAGDIVLMPSFDDGLPNGLLEGMAANLCPIVSDIFNGFINNYQNGIVLSKNNIYEMVNAISELANNKSLIKSLGENAKKKLLKWTPKDEALRYIEIFNKTLNH